MHRYILLFFTILFTQNLFGQCDTLQGQVIWRFWQDIPIYHWPDPLVDLYHRDRFPNGPDYTRTLYSLSTPNNYTDFYGSQIRGYIRTDSTGQVVFNVSGDDAVSFSLSTDNTRDNLVSINSDTSDIANLDTLTLVANQYYYFELNHYEIEGRDFASVEWKASFLPNQIDAENWTLVGGENIYQACESPCELRGTNCDDGDANTENDQYDGNCNCQGDPITVNSCVGERGILQAYLYENLPSGDLDSLHNAIAANVQPDTMETLSNLFDNNYHISDGAVPNYGVYVQGYLTVPVTGLYSFNITGSHDNELFISSDDAPANKTANHLFIPWWAGRYNHDNDYGGTPSNQTEENILLQAGQYYYIELRHKGADDDWQNFNVYWKTPYQIADQWKRIPTHYFFDYTCETMCIKSGVACNDGNPYTANDQWDGNCGCAGTPCTVPDCDDPTTSYNSSEECETTNEVSNRADDAWLSCTPVADAPNPVRNSRHWIQYDFGQLYDLGTTHVWNYNADGATNLGFENVIIDYSTDGIYWEELTTTTWNLADGTNGYVGFTGPDFSGITARYVLVSAADGGPGCRGISKIAFNAVTCPNIQFSNPVIDETVIEETSLAVTVNVTEGEAHINSVALYLNDMWIAADNSAPYNWPDLPELQNLASGDYKLSAVATDANGTECALSTQIHAVSLEDFPCQPDPIVLDTTERMVYRTEQTITSTGRVENAETAFYLAEQSITLMPDFHAVAGSEFTARILACNNTLQEVAQVRTLNLSNKTNGENSVNLFPNPVVSNFTLEIEAHQASTLEVKIYDILGKELANFNRRQLMDKGVMQLEIPTASLSAGLYFCKVQIGKEVITKSFVRVDRN